MLVRMAVRFAVRIGRRMRMPMMRLPVAWERINEIWYDYVKGSQPGRLFRHLRRRAPGYVIAPMR